MSQGTRIHVVVHGHVQGVFFRDTLRRSAREHDVSGWVRNRGDGTVEAVFEGDDSAVERMVDWMRSGPSSAWVERVDITEEEPEGLSDFGVR
jgi:acylphosphatase